jgi:hypothetical protein
MRAGSPEYKISTSFFDIAASCQVDWQGALIAQQIGICCTKKTAKRPTRSLLCPRLLHLVEQ